MPAGRLSRERQLSEGWVDVGLMPWRELEVIRFCESSLARGAEVTVVWQGSINARVFVRGLALDDEVLDLESTMDLTDEVSAEPELELVRAVTASALEPAQLEPCPDVAEPLGFLPPPSAPRGGPMEEDLDEDTVAYEAEGEAWPDVLAAELGQQLVDEIATCLDLLVPTGLRDADAPAGGLDEAEPTLVGPFNVGGRWLSVEPEGPIVSIGPQVDVNPATSWTPFSSLARDEESSDPQLQEAFGQVLVALDRLHLGTQGRLATWCLLELAEGRAELLLVGGESGRRPVARLYLKWEEQSPVVSVCLRHELQPDELESRPSLGPQPMRPPASGLDLRLAMGAVLAMGLFGGAVLTVWVRGF